MTPVERNVSKKKERSEQVMTRHDCFLAHLQGEIFPSKDVNTTPGQQQHDHHDQCCYTTTRAVIHFKVQENKRRRGDCSIQYSLSRWSQKAIVFERTCTLTLRSEWEEGRRAIIDPSDLFRLHIIHVVCTFAYYFSRKKEKWDRIYWLTSPTSSSPSSSWTCMDTLCSQFDKKSCFE